MRKLSSFIDRALRSPRGVVLALAFMSLLACGIGISDNKSATAFAGVEYMGGSYISEVFQDSEKISKKLPKAIANAILRHASKLSKVAIGDLKITQVTQKTFGNRCKFQFGEICSQEFNPIEGWEVVVQARKQSWTYHVNKSGSQIVLDPKVSKSGIVGSSESQ